MKKGFTLIELLAVIIILAVIALIATPVVLNVVNDAKVEANRNSTYGVLDAAKYYYAESLLDSSITGMDGKTNLMDKIVVSGEYPESGTLYIKSTGEVAIAAVYDNKCYTKEFNESEVTVSNDTSNCSVTAATESGSGSNPGGSGNVTPETGSGSTPQDTIAPTISINSTSSSGSSVQVYYTCTDASGILNESCSAVGTWVTEEYREQSTEIGKVGDINGQNGCYVSTLAPSAQYEVTINCCDNSYGINCAEEKVIVSTTGD